MSDVEMKRDGKLPTGLSALVGRAGKPGRGLPPVEKWNPPFCGDLDIRIASDGRWYYLGSPIGREPLVRLFASVLRKDEDGRHYLVTPVEKVGITVEDAPFVAVEMHVEGRGRAQRMTLRTNVGDIVEAGPDNPLRFAVEDGTGGLKPYVLVRGRLEALFSRPLLHQLVEHFEEETVGGRKMVGVWSGGLFFPAAAVDELSASEETA
ncbi:DUF1285 domain-containing protein [Rhizobiales bacterium]|uniref:DUF1285 domain-containing protein n=1 Tax=Hongsoonwoonella zoysiae TaxID=2821844 RepID=UPI00155FA8F7|nr:DUF1285 domain-containing protein [Hongsoonwoonella zoysiae]NRG17606.1 DUF1285 domain-containing protein [Hongsoonwoonella zoysiae]